MDAVTLDTSTLGLLVHPNLSGEPKSCRLWFERLQRANRVVILPEIADYELRRELVRIDSRRSIARLDVLKRRCVYLPISTPGMLRAAGLWAQMRRQGTPTADAARLDADVILAAHTQLYATAFDAHVVVATTNGRHVGRLVEARLWQEIEVPA